VREALSGLRLDSRVQVAADSRERPLHCHHEKLVIVDDELAFVGGIDLTDLAGDRFDQRGHPAREDVGWHDAAAELRGPAVTDVGAHFATRWHEVTGERLEVPPRPGPAGDHEVQVVRTVPEKVYDALPRGEFSILEAYSGALRAARRLVYVENQFLWSPEIVEILTDKLRNPPTDDFRLVAVLPVRPNNGADDTRGALGILLEADGGRGRLLACCRLALGSGEARNVYVHAKIAVVDDEWLTIGSANLNEHSLFNDTELNLVTHGPALARATRLYLWGEHLDCSPEELQGDSTEIVDQRLRPVAEEQLRRRQAGLPATHGLVQLPHVSRRARRLRGPIDGLLVDG
jgi:phosphatidylserine/phosphatidylglycerophosphate/cardiolipin synthase-like enzyme